MSPSTRTTRILGAPADVLIRRCQSLNHGESLRGDTRIVIGEIRKVGMKLVRYAARVMASFIHVNLDNLQIIDRDFVDDF